MRGQIERLQSRKKRKIPTGGREISYYALVYVGLRVNNKFNFIHFHTYRHGITLTASNK